MTKCSRCGALLAPGSPDCSACATAPEKVLVPSLIREGDVLEGRWRVLQSLGAGGMGLVMLAQEVGSSRRVAVKLLADAHCGREDSRQRFAREAKVASALRHPNIVAVEHVGAHGGRPFLVMNLLEGTPLSDVLRAHPGPLPEERVDAWVRQLCQALEYLRQRGLVHRDVKPSNLMVGPDDRLTLLDFGLLREGDATSVTQTGLVLGSPSYMSPEQARAAPEIDHRADLYAVGVILFELLCRTRPFLGSPSEVLQQHRGIL